MKKHYIKAVVALILQGRDVDAVLGNLTKVLALRGHQALYVHILKGVHTELLSNKRALAPLVVVASESDVQKQQAKITSALAALEGTLEEAVVKVDPTLIGGFTASHKGKLINESYKEKLVSLYRSITK